MGDPADAPTARDVSPDEMATLVGRIRLRQVRLVRWHGQTAPDASPDPRDTPDVETDLEPPLVRVEPTELSLWFKHHVRCRGKDGSDLAHIDTEVLLDFDLVGGGGPPDLALAACFADSNGAFMAWPYIREAVQTMSARIGVAPVTLDVLRREDWFPEVPAELAGQPALPLEK